MKSIQKSSFNPKRSSFKRICHSFHGIVLGLLFQISLNADAQDVYIPLPSPSDTLSFDSGQPKLPSPTRARSFSIVTKLPAKFKGYEGVISTYGYPWLYARGHFIDHQANEIWLVYAANSGGLNSWNWFVVIDLKSLSQKAVFSAGERYAKTFSLSYENGRRYLYTHVKDPEGVGIFDVTSLPKELSRVEPDRRIITSGGEFFSSWGLYHYISYEKKKSGLVPSFVVQALSSKLSPLNAITLPTEVPSGEQLKIQGVCAGPQYIAVAFGGSFVPERPISAKNLQGFRIVSPSGSVIAESIFNPETVMENLNSMGIFATRLETEGLFIDNDGRITSLWHVNQKGRGLMLVIEAFSGAHDAFTLPGCQ